MKYLTKNIGIFPQYYEAELMRWHLKPELKCYAETLLDLIKINDPVNLSKEMLLLALIDRPIK